MVTSLIIWIVVAIIIITFVLIVLHLAKIGFLKNKKYKNVLYPLLSIEIIILLLSLFGEPILNKIFGYRDNVLNKSEEECKRDDAPFWCNF